MEVEEMINKVREEQGRPFDVTQLTASCMINIIVNMLFGFRFDHSDEALQQFISDMHEFFTNYSMTLDLFPFLRFLPYFKKRIARYVEIYQFVTPWINDNISTCIEVCIFVCIVIIIIIIIIKYSILLLESCPFHELSPCRCSAQVAIKSSLLGSL